MWVRRFKKNLASDLSFLPTQPGKKFQIERVEQISGRFLPHLWLLAGGQVDFKAGEWEGTGRMPLAYVVPESLDVSMEESRFKGTIHRFSVPSHPFASCQRVKMQHSVSPCTVKARSRHTYQDEENIAYQ